MPCVLRFLGPFMNVDWLFESSAWEVLRSYFTPTVALVLSLASLVMFIASALITPWLLVRMPADYFLRDKPHLWTRLRQSPPLACVVLLMKNALGVICIGAGILMLVLPGQGLLTILVGVFLLDFHGKKELEKKLISRPKIRKTINWLRRRYHRPELVLDEP